MYFQNYFKNKQKYKVEKILRLRLRMTNKKDPIKLGS